jgi:hypothetical protein
VLVVPLVLAGVALREAGEGLADEYACVVDQGVDAAEPVQRRIDDPACGRGLGDVSGDGEQIWGPRLA